MATHRRVAVIGAGPAGLTAAYVLAKKGVAVDVYEASPFVGGMARSIEMWGQTVDIGPHRFFSSDPRVNALWLDVIGTDYRMVNRLTRIFFRNKFYYYPVKAGNALKNLGLFEAIRCLVSYMWQRLKPGRNDLGETFESWVIARFGKRLYRHFFKTYSEKLWGVSTSDLDSDFASQRIKKLSLGETVKNALFGGGAEKHKTLVEQFAYATGGTGQVYERMSDYVKNHGGNVYLGTPVDSLITSDETVQGIKLASGELREYDEVISSMPITLLVGRLPNVPPEVEKASKSLRFRNTVIVYLQVDARNIFPDNWIYIHSAELRTGRITNFRNWVPDITNGKPEAILAMEYWCFDEDDFWHWDDTRYVELAREEIVKTGLLESNQILDGKVVRVPKCYPLYRRGYKDQLCLVEDHLRRYEHLQVVGRYGAFKYNNQDHSILMGLLAAENITEDAQHDLWNTNSDDEYQESSRIVATGLVANEHAT